ncbi:hypothetical protein B0A55_07654 [Friedmanniomyces simplex]|uniref:Late embryogenesis abundant protein LEA-2 subgroup domain-containing protein n=1 Tax=Friedmanniomyces simplex TaxID=329884 RepID=A0A4U0X493_9PEZI|nr:hypothetical protein B0A55_07654 [Friedmanniomyces simplex]
MANTNNHTPDFKTMSGKTETAEPGGGGGGGAASAAAASASSQRRSPSQQRQMSSSSQSTTAVPPLRRQRSSNLVPSASPSAGSSPHTSRNTSPIRKDSRPQPLSTPSSTQPSAAAIQRALSAANVPQLPATGSVTDAVSKLPRATRGAGGGSGDTTLQWPVSPRLKSPPPSGATSRRGSTQAQQKKVDTVIAPSINVQSATPQTSTPPPKLGGEEVKRVEQQLQAPPKASSRGPSGKSTLETVQENSADTISEPAAAVQAAADLKPLTKINEEDKGAATKRDGPEPEKHTQHGESGSESAGSKLDRTRGRRQSLTQPKVNPRPANATKSSFTPLQSAKSRQQSEGKHNMTVETETVQSIPQSALNAGDRTGSGRNDPSGSIRLKPSNETIRPKKERKKPAQKARSINQGTASSKADIFEARVASAVEQENTSDSDETFVYESNPPETQRRPRHHSRTPSVTSSHSMADQQRGGIRNFGDMLDEQQRKVAGKRSMKFSNNPYNDVDSPDSKNGTVRSNQARHFGKFGRGGSHASSMYDPESPFTQASKLRTGHLNTRQSRPNSPRSPQSVQQQHRPSGLFSGRKTEQSFDFDGEGADDERTPLVGTVRTPRGVPRHRRHESGDTVQSIDEYYGVRREPRFGRFGGCLLGFCVLAAVVLSTVAFLVMSNRPMYDVRISKIQNVLASEQEIMLDLYVGAVNPNALSITVMDMDLNVFAKSRHVGSDLDAPEHDHAQRTTRARRKAERRAEERSPAEAGNPSPWQDMSGHWHAPSGGKDAQTMLLGRILHFDQALSFEGSPIKRHQHFSLGELRLMRPGNKTEAGGSERWERTLLHPFELVVRGVLKYQLPVSMREQSVSVGASVLVHPEEGVGVEGRMRVEPVGHWQWIDWEDVVQDGGVGDGDGKRVMERVPSEILTFAAGVGDSAALDKAFASTKKEAGPIDVIVADAGYMIASLLTEVDVDDWWNGFDVSPKGTLLTFGAFAANRGGWKPVFIGINSSVSHAGVYPSMSSYAVSKLGSVQLVTYLAAENQGIRAASVSVLERDMTNRTEMGLSSDDMSLPAGFAVWLATDRGDFVNGRVLWAHWFVEELEGRKDGIPEQRPIMLPETLLNAFALVLGCHLLRGVAAAAVPADSARTPADYSAQVEVPAADVESWLGKRAVPGNETDTTLQSTQSWYWAGVNTTVTGYPSNPTVNLTGEAQPEEKYLNVNYFKDAAKSVSCADGHMNFTLKDQDKFASVQQGWSWMNEDNHTVCLVTEPGTCGNTRRQPYRATYVTFDNQTQTASVTASNWTWQEALPKWSMRINTAGLLNSTSSNDSSLEKRIDQKASLDLTQTFNANFANLTADGVTASIGCTDCSTRGTLNLDFNVSFDLLANPKLSGTASITPSGVGANVELGLTVSAELTSELAGDLTIADVPLPGGVDILGVAKIGPQFVVVANAAITSITAATTISFGVAVDVPDNSLATIDFANSANNAFNGWDPTFSTIGPNLDASVSVTGSAGPEIRLEIDAEIVGQGLSAGLKLAVPQFTLDASAQASPEGGICGDDNAQLGIEFDVNLAAELDAFGAVAAASALQGEFTLLSTATQIFSTCMGWELLVV